MPIYEYRCASCGAELEKLQKISDPALVECPECGKDSLVKLVSASSFRLKGSGWYETDFKTGKKRNGAGDAEASTDSSAPAPAKESGGSAKDSAGTGSGKGTETAGVDTSKAATKESKKEAKSSDGSGTGMKKKKPVPKE